MSKKKNLDPAYTVISRLGGYRPTARVLGISPGAVLRWTLPANRQGSDGTIPQRHWLPILNYAKRNNIEISLLDLANIR